MMNGTWRIPSIVVVTTMAIAGFSSGARAMHHVHRAHFSKSMIQQHVAPGDSHPVSVALPAMRYYGGPKSPMWRG